MEITLNVEHKHGIMCMHEQLASGDIGGRKFRLITDMGRNALILQLDTPDKPEWDSFVIKMTSLCEALASAGVKEPILGLQFKAEALQ